MIYRFLAPGLPIFIRIEHASGGTLARQPGACSPVAWSQAKRHCAWTCCNRGFTAERGAGSAQRGARSGERAAGSAALAVPAVLALEPEPVDPRPPGLQALRRDGEFCFFAAQPV